MPGEHSTEQLSGCLTEGKAIHSCHFSPCYHSPRAQHPSASLGKPIKSLSVAKGLVVVAGLNFPDQEGRA